MRFALKGVSKKSVKELSQEMSILMERRILMEVRGAPGRRSLQLRSSLARLFGTGYTVKIGRVLRIRVWPAVW